MLAATLVSLLVGQDSDRLRSILPNESVVFAQRVSGARSVSISLFLGGLPAPETPATQGRRHLLEHLMARGVDGRVDEELETAGGMLVASTTRDAIQFEVVVPPTALRTGFQALRAVMSLGPVTEAMIAREVEVIRQEGLTRGPTSRLLADAWTQAYGEAGLDPFGDRDVLAATTPDHVRALSRALFVGRNVVLTVAGDVNVDVAVQEATALVSPLPPGRGGVPPRLTAVGTEGGSVGGRAWFARVGSVRDSATAATLAAGLVLASKLESPFLAYSPTTAGGLVTLGSGQVRTLPALDPAVEIGTGRAMAREWLARQTSDVRGISSLHGLLALQGPALRPETVRDAIDRFTLDQFAQALRRFGAAR